MWGRKRGIQSGKVCGVRNASDTSGRIVTHLNLQGADIRGAKTSSASACRTECLSTPRCVAFTFITKGGSNTRRQCWLKHPGFVEQHSLGTVSGFVLQRSLHQAAQPAASRAGHTLVHHPSDSKRSDHSHACMSAFILAGQSNVLGIGVDHAKLPPWLTDPQWQAHAWQTGIIAVNVSAESCR